MEIFDNRIEITNPGIPLIDTLRFIDEPPKSRNEELAALMRRMKICEERGSGIDKVIFQIELYQLPPPDFIVTDGSTIAVLFKSTNLSEMGRQEKVRACINTPAFNGFQERKCQIIPCENVCLLRIQIIPWHQEFLKTQ